VENGDLVRWFTHLTWWFSIHNSGRSPRFSWLNQLVRLGDFQVRKLLVYQRVSPTQRSRFVCQLTNKVYDRYIISMAFYGVVNQLITRAHHLFFVSVTNRKCADSEVLGTWRIIGDSRGPRDRWAAMPCPSKSYLWLQTNYYGDSSTYSVTTCSERGKILHFMTPMWTISFFHFRTLKRPAKKATSSSLQVQLWRQNHGRKVHFLHQSRHLPTSRRHGEDHRIWYVCDWQRLGEE